ncbi:hypothetical protein JMS36_005331, partial [Salmonella enterica]|nr:hypothetical protein [Salmonella enterica]
SAEPTTNKETETTPTVTKTLAEAVKAVNPTEVTFEQGMSDVNPSGAKNLDVLLTYMQSADFSKATDRASATTSVHYAHGLLFDAYNTAKGTPNAATALQKLVAFNRATAEQMVKGDTAALNKTMDTQKEAIDGARNSISQELKGLSEADSKARAAYDSAIADFLKKTPEEQQDSEVQKQLMATLTAKSGPLVSTAGFNDIHPDANGGFKTYDELLESAGKSGTNILTSHVALLNAKDQLNDALGSV